MFEINELTGILNFSVVAFCFIIGYLIKNYSTIPNKNIPLIMLVVGSFCNIILVSSDPDESVTMNTLIIGAISGLASSGAYELIVNMFNIKGPVDTGKKDIEKKEEETDIKPVIENESDDESIDVVPDLTEDER
jgi:hypothetical protein